MKKVALIFLFIASSVVLTYAQVSQDKSYNDPAASKEVHRVGNKNKFSPSIRIASGDVNSVVSKGIHKKQIVESGSVATTGYPTWTISKEPHASKPSALIVNR
jgi:hypothetical protein